MKHDDLYFMLNAALGIIKIGIAGDVEARRQTLECGCGVPLRILRVVKGGSRYEKDLHDAFGRSRLLGEWFEPTDELWTLANGDTDIAGFIKERAEATAAFVREREAAKEARRLDQAEASRAHREEVARLKVEEERLKRERAEATKKAREAAERKRRERLDLERQEREAETAARLERDVLKLRQSDEAMAAAARRAWIAQRARNAALLGVNPYETQQSTATGALGGS